MRQFYKLLILFFIALTVLTNAQVSNPSFETWADDKPELWNVSNYLNLATPVTKSTESYSGSFALKGEVVGASTTSGDVFVPVINSIPAFDSFPNPQKYASMELYYQFHPAGGDVFVVTILMYNEQTLLGGGAVKLYDATTTYTKLNVPIEYFIEGVPNFCTVIIGARNEDDATVGNLGTWFLVDDISFGGTTGIEDNNNNLPEGFALEQNYPNPFNPSTTIEFSLPASEKVSLKIYNLLGQEIATLFNEKEMSAGSHRIQWNADNFANGTYIYRLTSGNYSVTQKMILLK